MDLAYLAYLVCPFHKRLKSANMRSESFIRNSKSRLFLAGTLVASNSSLMIDAGCPQQPI